MSFFINGFRVNGKCTIYFFSDLLNCWIHQTHAQLVERLFNLYCQVDDVCREDMAYITDPESLRLTDFTGVNHVTPLFQFIIKLVELE